MPLTSGARWVLAGAVAMIVAIGSATIVAVEQRRADRMPHFVCSDGSRMYVDSPAQRFRIDSGEWVQAGAKDQGYYETYMACDPDIRP